MTRSVHQPFLEVYHHFTDHLMTTTHPFFEQQLLSSEPLLEFSSLFFVLLFSRLLSLFLFSALVSFLFLFSFTIVFVFPFTIPSLSSLEMENTKVYAVMQCHPRACPKLAGLEEHSCLLNQNMLREMYPVLLTHIRRKYPWLSTKSLLSCHSCEYCARCQKAFIFGSLAQNRACIAHEMRCTIIYLIRLVPIYNLYPQAKII